MHGWCITPPYDTRAVPGASDDRRSSPVSAVRRANMPSRRRSHLGSGGSPNATRAASSASRTCACSAPRASSASASASGQRRERYSPGRGDAVWRWVSVKCRSNSGRSCGCGDPLLLQPRPVLVPVLARDRASRVDLVGPQLDVLVDVAGCGRPAEAALHVAEVEVRLDCQPGCSRSLARPETAVGLRVEGARLAERVCGVQRELDLRIVVGHPQVGLGSDRVARGRLDVGAVHVDQRVADRPPRRAAGAVGGSAGTGCRARG